MFGNQHIKNNTSSPRTTAELLHGFILVSAGSTPKDLTYIVTCTFSRECLNYTIFLIINILPFYL